MSRNQGSASVNIPSSCAGLTAGGLEITPDGAGGGPGYGAAYASDPGGLLTWQ